MKNYNETKIETCLNLLDNITIKGIEDAKRVAMIATILENPEKEKNDGDNED